MIKLKETATRLSLEGPTEHIEHLIVSFRYHPANYWMSDAYQLFKKTGGTSGWDGYLYPMRRLAWGHGKTTAEIARGFLDDVVERIKRYNFGLDDHELLIKPFSGISVEDIPKDIVKSEFELDELQLTAIAAWLDGVIGINYVTVSGGKCLGRGTPVLMFDGSRKRVEDVKVGDLLMGPDSRSRRVRSTTSGRSDLYKVFQQNGDNFICNDEHILVLKKFEVHGRYSRRRDVQIRAKDFYALPNWKKALYSAFKAELDFSEVATPVEPYFLGLWLGDGIAFQPSVTVADQDTEILAYLQQYAVRLGMDLSYGAGQGCQLVRFVSLTQGWHNNFVREALKSLNVLGNKHIPLSYFKNSKKVRLDLLAGIIDSDGSVSKDKGSAYVGLASKKLALSVLDLCRSLGFKASISAKKTGIKRLKFIGTAWVVYIGGDIASIPTKLPRKKGRRQAGRNKSECSIKVRRWGTGDYYGFELSGDGLFLLGDFTVTHNTVMFAAASAMVKRRYPKARFLYFTQSERLVRQVHSELTKFLPDWHITRFGGGSKDESGKDIVVVTGAMLNTHFKRLKNEGWFKTFMGVLVDECFPAGTLVDGVPIENVKVGDLVRSFDSGSAVLKKVIKTFKSVPKLVVRVFLDDGSSFCCTAGHPVLTSEGYVCALSLNSSMVVVRVDEKRCLLPMSRERPRKGSLRKRTPVVLSSVQTGQKAEEDKDFEATVPLLRRGRYLSWERAVLPVAVSIQAWKSLLLRALQEYSCAAAKLAHNVKNKLNLFSNNFMSDEIGQSSFKTRGKSKDQEGIEGEVDVSSRWKWTRSNSSSTYPVLGLKLAKSSNGTSDQHERNGQRWDSVNKMLPCRRRDTKLEVSRRSGRRESLLSSSKTARCLENSAFELVRVDRVEILEQSSDGTFGGVCPDGYVYNLEVEDTHNYFVDGIVVHNCHHAASPTWSKVLQVVPAFFRLGASDTMCEDDPARWHAIRGLVGPIRSKIEARQLIKDMAMSMASSGRLAKPHIYLVDVPEWSGRFRNVPHSPEPDTEAWALISGEWKKGLYLGPVFETDPESPDGIKRDKAGDPIKLDNCHRLAIDGVERDVESRWCLLQRTRDQAIIRFNERNRLVTQWTKYYSEKGWPTLVVCTPTLHILILKSLISTELGKDKVKILYSEHDSRERDEVFAWLQATPGAVLISSLVKEGVSLPEIRGGVIADYVAGWEVARQMIGRFVRKKPTGDNYACMTAFVERQHPKLVTKSIQMLDKLSKTRGFVFYHPVTTPDSISSAQKFDAE